jgi:hypothetical protein
MSFSRDHSPDLALRDYHLFTYLNNWLGSQLFNSNEELMGGVKTWLSSYVVDFSDFFHTGIQKTYSPIWQVQLQRLLFEEPS